MSTEPLFTLTDFDRSFYGERIEPFMPARAVDIHTHVWLDNLKSHASDAYRRVVNWPARVARQNSIEDLLETYRLMFPRKSVTPLIFSSIKEGDIIDELNRYVRGCAEAHRLPSLLYARPDWPAEKLEQGVLDGRFLGVKVYLNLAPAHLAVEDITIFDFLPPHQLEVIDQHGWIVMLHIPRNGRLRDPVNLRQMLAIEERYPGIKLIVAHVGRAYCNEDVGNAFDVLAPTRSMLFDISANCNDWVFEQLITAVGPQRILFGSDLPILRMRTRRICENGMYVNLVPEGLYGDVSADPHMREVSGVEAAEMTFFMYEEIDAFRRAAERTGLSTSDVADVFYGNAARLLRSVGYELPSADEAPDYRDGPAAPPSSEAQQA